MSIKETEAKSILRKHKKIDSWFLSRYGMNLYRGGTHNCVYCDGRAEGYYVEGEFGKDVVVKVNAIEILKQELDPKRKRTPFKRAPSGFHYFWRYDSKIWQAKRLLFQNVEKTIPRIHFRIREPVSWRQMGQRKRRILSFIKSNL